MGSSLREESVRSDQNGAPGATRTRGTGLRRALLYPPELRGRKSFRDGSLSVSVPLLSRQEARALKPAGPIALLKKKAPEEADSQDATTH